MVSLHQMLFQLQALYTETMGKQFQWWLIKLGAFLHLTINQRIIDI